MKKRKKILKQRTEVIIKQLSPVVKLESIDEYLGSPDTDTYVLGLDIICHINKENILGALNYAYKSINKKHYPKTHRDRLNRLRENGHDAGISFIDIIGDYNYLFLVPTDM